MRCTPNRNLLLLSNVNKVSAIGQSCIYFQQNWLAISWVEDGSHCVMPQHGLQLCQLGDTQVIVSLRSQTCFPCCTSERMCVLNLEVDQATFRPKTQNGNQNKHDKKSPLRSTNISKWRSLRGDLST